MCAHMCMTERFIIWIEFVYFSTSRRDSLWSCETRWKLYYRYYLTMESSARPLSSYSTDYYLSTVTRRRALSLFEPSSIVRGSEKLMRSSKNRFLPPPLPEEKKRAEKCFSLSNVFLKPLIDLLGNFPHICVYGRSLRHAKEKADRTDVFI